MNPVDLAFTILGLLATPYGLMALMVGFLLFFFAPIVPRVTRRYRFLARLHIWLGVTMLSRAAIVVSEHGDLLLKRMTPDDIGTERIKFNDDIKEFEDPHQAKSYWMGIPFALADEVHGVLFDPTDAALGLKKQRSREQGEMVTKATEAEREMYEKQGWVKGVFEFPGNAYELVDLNRIRHLIPGSERAEHPKRVEKFYQLSRKPYDSSSSTIKYIMLIVAALAPFGMVWLIWSQLSGGNTPQDSVSYGALFLIPILKSYVPTKDQLKYVLGQIIHYTKELTIAVIVFGWLPAGFYGLYSLTSLTVAIAVYIIIGIGFWIVPIMLQLLKASTGVSDKVAPKIIKLGFLAFDDPVFTLTPSGYKVKNYQNMNVSETHWHTLLGRRVGFSFEPKRELWDTELADTNRLEAETLADGGAKTNIPNGYKRAPERGRAVYGNIVPNRFNSNKIYVKTGIALKRFAHVATGRKSHQRLLAAKDEFGDAQTLTQNRMIVTMAALSIVSLLSGIGVFFVLL